MAGLSLSEVARRIGLRRPSLYKSFPSKLAVYDALLARAASEVLAVFRSTAADAAPGLPALTAAVKAAADRAQLHPAAATDEGEALLSLLFVGMVTQQPANEPDAATSRAASPVLAPQLLHMSTRTYPPQE